MSKDFSINIKDLSGIYRSMAEKANIFGGDTLEYAEISIFNDIESTYNKKNKTFIFDNKLYNEYGNEADFCARSYEKNVSTRVFNQYKILDTDKNIDAIEKAKQYAKQLDKSQNKTVTVKKTINGKEVSFSYNRKSIEDYIINNAVDSGGNKIKYFESIPQIRQKMFSVRTKEEIRKLAEFNNMVNSAINAGVEYGVDPKLIVAIMQREVGFDGLSKKVVGVNGKGYMQLTSIAVKDMLGVYTKNNKQCFTENIRTDLYGKEMEELLKSRGFSVDPSSENRADLVNKIVDYLIDNNDADFNIRLGTLLLRKHMQKYNGNIELTAQNYNGNSKNNIKYNYGRAVKNFYDKLSNIEGNKA